MANHQDEQTPLLQPNHRPNEHDEEATSFIKSHITLSEQKMASSGVGERLPYNDYTTIDWLHDLVKDSYRLRFIHGRKGIRYRVEALWDEASGWVAAALIGTLTACVAFGVDVGVAVVSDCEHTPLFCSLIDSWTAGRSQTDHTV